MEELHIRLDQFDAGLKSVMPHRVRQQVLWCIVGGCEHSDSTAESVLEQPCQQTCVAGIVDVQLIEEQQPARAGHIVDCPVHSFPLGAVIVDVAMELVEEAVEVNAGLLGRRHCCVERVGQPRLTPAGVAIDVQATRRRLASLLLVGCCCNTSESVEQSPLAGVQSEPGPRRRCINRRNELLL